jgi:hypothetical protein
LPQKNIQFKCGCETVPDCFKPETKRIAFLVSAVLFVFLSLFLTGGEAKAASYTVNSDADVGDAKEGNGICDSDLATPGEQCTLRAALRGIELYSRH